MNTMSNRTRVVGSMRSVMLGTCLAMLGTLPMMAQDASAPPPQQGDAGQPGGRPSPSQMVDRQMEHLTKALSLTPAQATQIKPILQTQMTKMMALRQDTETPQMDKRQQMMQIHTDSQTQIRGLLTSDQQPKYDALLQQEQQHMGHHRGGMNGGGQSDQAPPPQD
jgi:periplasmic protein CpxP/Spy